MNKRIAAFLFASLAANPALADGGGWLAVGLSQVDLDFSAADLDDGSFTSSTESGKDTGFRLAGGFDFNDNAGFEISYRDFGSSTASGVSDGSGPDWFPGLVSGEVSATAFSFGLNGYVPLGDRARLVGKLGMAMWDADITVSHLGISMDGSDDGNDPYLGLGIEGDLSQGVAASLAIVRDDLEDADVNSIELGLRRRLGR